MEQYSKRFSERLRGERGEIGRLFVMAGVFAIFWYSGMAILSWIAYVKLERGYGPRGSYVIEESSFDQQPGSYRVHY